MRINKLHFIGELSTRIGVSAAVGEMIVAAYNELVFEWVKQDKTVATGLGQFSRSHRKARIGVNPRTLKAITIPALVTPKFRSSDTFKKAIR